MVRWSGDGSMVFFFFSLMVQWSWCGSWVVGRGRGSRFLGCDFFFLLLFMAAMDLAGGGNGGWMWSFF